LQKQTTANPSGPLSLALLGGNLNNPSGFAQLKKRVASVVDPGLFPDSLPKSLNRCSFVALSLQFRCNHPLY
jgi:hypothetical protein